MKKQENEYFINFILLVCFDDFLKLKYYPASSSTKPKQKKNK